MLSFEDLRDDQQASIDHLFGSDGCFLVMRMGGGKTATILTAVAELMEEGHRRKAIVMAPPLVAHTVWVKEPGKWEHLRGLKVEALVGSRMQRRKQLQKTDADILTVSDGLTEWLVDWLMELPEDDPWLDLFIYDEPKLKSPRGKIGRHLEKLSHRVKTMWFLSGTPRPNGYEDLYRPIRILSRGAVWSENFDHWRRRNFMPMDYHGYRWEVHDFRRPVLDKAMRPYLVTAPLPANARESAIIAGDDQDFEIDLPKDARETYDEMEKHLLAEVRDKLGPESSESALVAALSQAVASSKLEQIAQGYIYDEGESIARLHDQKVEALKYLLDAAGSEAVVIVYRFREDLKLIEEALGKGRKSRILGGGVSQKKKLRSIDEWNEKKLDALILHPASAGHGVELQHGGSRMIWFCPIWSNEQYDQTLKRLDRPGQTEPVFSHQIVARGTVDIVKRNRVVHKMAEHEAFLDLVRKL